MALSGKSLGKAAWISDVACWWSRSAMSPGNVTINPDCAITAQQPHQDLTSLTWAKPSSHTTLLCRHAKTTHSYSQLQTVTSRNGSLETVAANTYMQVLFSLTLSLSVSLSLTPNSTPIQNQRCFSSQRNTRLLRADCTNNSNGAPTPATGFVAWGRSSMFELWALCRVQLTWEVMANV